jgi:ABC-type transporter Mla MlaB component
LFWLSAVVGEASFIDLIGPWSFHGTAKYCRAGRGIDMSAAGSQSFPLTGAVTVREVAHLAGTLQAALTASGSLLIDCTGLTEIDLAGVQLLVAAHKSARAAGTSLSLRTPPDGPLPTLLRQAGFVTAEGRPLTREGDFWLDAGSKAA